MNVETAPYWDGCRRHELLIQHCADCGRHQFYPRLICVACGGRRLHWVRASGRATIGSFTIVRSAPPRVIALVTLAEGPSMMTHIVGCEFDALRIGMPVAVVFDETAGGDPLPRFKP